MELMIAFFIQGALSIYSPCILPLIPIYMGYLTSGAKVIDHDGKVQYKKSKVLLTTFFFVLGISSVFFIAGLSMSVIRQWLQEYRIILTLLGGGLLVFLGLFHLEIISIPALNKEFRIHTKKDQSMNFFQAFLLGFLFSFAWTPCIGPLLSSALILAASAKDSLLGNLYILSYTLGFIFSFMCLGLFTEEILNLFKKNQKIMKRIIYLGGGLVLLMGLWMIGTASQDILLLQNQYNSNSNQVGEYHNIEECDDVEHNHDGPTKDIDQYDFVLKDQNGVTHQLSNYEGKPIIVTFFATWCTYCKEELPVLQELQEENHAQVFIVAAPNVGQEGTEEELRQFIEENGYEDLIFLFDDGTTFRHYQVTGFPTSFIYTNSGELLGYLPGKVGKEVFMELLDSLE